MYRVAWKRGYHVTSVSQTNYNLGQIYIFKIFISKI